MDIRKRKLMFYTFIVAFFAISFFALLYAQGYRFNLTWPPDLDQTLQRTGMILVKTTPGEATILLNSKNPKTISQQFLSQDRDPIKTPAKIKRIKPGTYNLTITRKGYHNWQREIEVHPGRITTITNIHLIKNELPVRIADTKIEKDTLSPQKNYILDRDRTRIINLASEKTISLPTTTATSSFKWSPNEEKLLLENKVFSLSQKKVISEWGQKIPRNSVADIEWGDNSKKLYYPEQKELIELTLRTGETKKIIDLKGKLTDFTVEENYIHLMTAKNNESQLKVYSFSKDEIIKIIDFPFSAEYEIASTPGPEELTVYDRRYNTLYVISPLAPVAPLQETVNNVKFFHWQGADKLIYGNDFEVWNLDLVHHNKNLITRRSEKILGALPHPETQKIIYFTSDNINIIEEIKSNKIKRTELIKLPTISEVFLGPEEKNLYFNTNIGHHQGVYKLTIY